MDALMIALVVVALFLIGSVFLMKKGKQTDATDSAYSEESMVTIPSTPSDAMIPSPDSRPTVLSGDQLIALNEQSGGKLLGTAQGVVPGYEKVATRIALLNALSAEEDKFRAAYIVPLAREIGKLETETAYIKAYPGATAAAGLARRHARIDELKAKLAPYEEEYKKFAEERKAIIAKYR